MVSPWQFIGGLEIYLFGAIAAQGIAIRSIRKSIGSAQEHCRYFIYRLYRHRRPVCLRRNIDFLVFLFPAAGAAIFGIVLNSF
jgi:hypothetical protein